MALVDHLNKMSYYCAIVENRSLIRASSAIGITQPQLSRVVKQLEEELETQLFVRSPSGVDVTKDGLELYGFAKDLILKTAEIEKKLKYKTSDFSGLIRIGTYDSIARYFFPSFLKYMKATLPKVEVQLETSRSSDILKKIKAKKLDLGVFVHQNDLPQRGLFSEKIYSDSFGFYHHPALKKDFRDQVILFPDSLERETGFGLKPLLKSRGLRSQIISDNLETVKSLSEEAVGVGLLPHRVAREAVLQGKLVELEGSRQKTELFPHEIRLCHPRTEIAPKIQSIKEELIHFLQTWSKN